MDRRQFMGRSILALGAATTVWPRWTRAAESEPLEDYHWQFKFDRTLENQADLYISVERYWLGSNEAAHEAVFGDEPIESGEHPLEDSISGWFPGMPEVVLHLGRLWGEDIRVSQAFCAVDAYVWIVTCDVGTPEWVREMVVQSVFEFDEPRVPRDWQAHRWGSLKHHN